MKTKILKFIITILTIFLIFLIFKIIDLINEGSFINPYVMIDNHLIVSSFIVVFSIIITFYLKKRTSLPRSEKNLLEMMSLKSTIILQKTRQYQMSFLKKKTSYQNY